MIFYRREIIYLPGRLFQITGSVNPKSLVFSLPCAAVTATLKYCFQEGYLSELYFDGHESVMKDSSAYSGFVVLVGFLIIFRTSQAYARYSDGCASLYRMRAEWYSAVSSLIAFCKFGQAKCDPKGALAFQHVLVRLFSLLHGVALGAVEDSCPVAEDDRVAFKYQLVDPEALDAESLRTIKHCNAKTELVYQWIQQLIVESLDNGSIQIPAPVLSGAFRSLSQGMAAFRDSMKISDVPFPFPYAQVCEWLLMLHWCCTPIVVAMYASTIWSAALFTFLQVHVYWALNAIAIEVENPFGMDANDLNAAELQEEMNEHLLLLMDKSTWRTPFIAPANGSSSDCLFTAKSLAQTWDHLPSGERRRASVLTPIAAATSKTRRASQASSILRLSRPESFVVSLMSCNSAEVDNHSSYESPRASSLDRNSDVQEPFRFTRSCSPAKSISPRHSRTSGTPDVFFPGKGAIEPCDFASPTEPLEALAEETRTTFDVSSTVASSFESSRSKGSNEHMASQRSEPLREEDGQQEDLTDPPELLETTHTEVPYSSPPVSKTVSTSTRYRPKSAGKIEKYSGPALCKTALSQPLAKIPPPCRPSLSDEDSSGSSFTESDRGDED